MRFANLKFHVAVTDLIALLSIVALIVGLIIGQTIISYIAGAILLMLILLACFNLLRGKPKTRN